MILARIVGRVVATHKDDGLTGRKLLVLQPIGPDGEPRGAPVVGVDAVGAGAAELVVLVRGREAAHAFLPAAVPADAGIVGIVDHATIEG